jgi:ornithine cyclodeaminase/alanine dehydrogenase-like protein (mu-crystallin family)
VNLVEGRVWLDAEERTARRKASRMRRAKKEAEHPIASAREDAAPAPVVTTIGTTTEPVIADSQLPEAVTTLPQEADQPVELVATSRKRKRNSLLTASRRAERNSRLVSRLPAGQRWKRRLPKACR